MSDEKEALREDEQEKKKWKKISLKPGRDNFLIILLAGVLLLVIAWPVKEEDKNANSATQSGQWDSEGSMMNLKSQTGQNAGQGLKSDEGEWYAYASYLEESLEELLATMDGVGQVRVMVTLKSTGETIVEKDKSTTRSNTTEVDSAGGSRNTADVKSEEETVYGDGSLPFVTKLTAPLVEGVVVSAQGGANAKTAQNITEAIQALFGIEAHKIKVVKMISQ